MRILAYDIFTSFHVYPESGIHKKKKILYWRMSTLVTPRQVKSNDETPCIAFVMSRAEMCEPIALFSDKRNKEIFFFSRQRLLTTT